ncbi:hypothetical protein AO269_24985 [Pseudomonas putida]|nr:hypothetical protein AO269_24985 [Pseudomonas putida]
MSQQSQFALLGKRRFLPFFVTQALGAFNDNIFKQSLILTILYKLAIEGDRSVWVNLCALLFILPFFLFSALAGQFGEKFPKHRLIRSCPRHCAPKNWSGATAWWKWAHSWRSWRALSVPG